MDLVAIYRHQILENAALLEGLGNLQDAFVEKLENDTLGMFYFQYISSFDGIIIEYLRLSFKYPEKSEGALFTLFRESVREEKTVIIFP